MLAYGSYGPNKWPQRSSTVRETRSFQVLKYLLTACPNGAVFHIDYGGIHYKYTISVIELVWLRK